MGTNVNFDPLKGLVSSETPTNEPGTFKVNGVEVTGGASGTTQRGGTTNVIANGLNASFVVAGAGTGYYTETANDVINVVRTDALFSFTSLQVLNADTHVFTVTGLPLDPADDIAITHYQFNGSISGEPAVFKVSEDGRSITLPAAGQFATIKLRIAWTYLVDPA